MIREQLVRCARAAVRAPAVHFVVLGTLLFAVSTRVPERPAPAPAPAGRAPIVITAARIAEIRADYQQTVGSSPTPAELSALIDREADEQMLYQEALMLGLDRNDRTVEWRVVEKMQFLFGEDVVVDKAEAFRRGVALGLARDDIMVRNTMVTKMRLLAKAASRHEEPGGPALDHALEAYYREHHDAYAQPERVTVSHVFVSAARHGAALDADAGVLRERLVASRTPPDAATRWGDAFAAGSTFRGVTPSTLAKTFGDAFTTHVLALEAGGWSEPIRSPYGLHLVWVAERQGGTVPELDAVRSRVLRAFRAERHEQYLARMMAELRQAYSVRIEEDGRAKG